MNDERNQQIVTLYRDEKLTLQQVADLHSLTRERVRQILVAEGCRERHIKWPVCERCGQEDHGFWQSGRKRWSSRWCRPCAEILAEERVEKKKAEMIEEIREFAAVHGRTPGGADFNRSLGRISPERLAEAQACVAVTPLPSASEIQRYFGSVSAFVTQSGLTPSPIGAKAAREGRERRERSAV